MARCGVDRIVGASVIEEYRNRNIDLHNHDIENNSELPFDNNRFDVITMLAVLEHIELLQAPGILAEVLRLLKPGGVFLLTTPAAWAHWLIRMLASVHFLSRVEIEEHKTTYTLSGLVMVLTESGFRPDRVTTGSFEMHLNLWATALKD
jgi:2-polyprenyl-3-methyl-5-hydroxy-6-metoxy-1,4-benzoquinol methylase